MPGGVWRRGEWWWWRNPVAGWWKSCRRLRVCLRLFAKPMPVARVGVLTPPQAGKRSPEANRASTIGRVEWGLPRRSARAFGVALHRERQPCRASLPGTTDRADHLEGAIRARRAQSHSNISCHRSAGNRGQAARWNGELPSLQSCTRRLRRFAGSLDLVRSWRALSGAPVSISMLHAGRGRVVCA